MRRFVWGVDQQLAVDTGLTLREVVFLDWFAHWTSQGTMVQHRVAGRSYFWVDRKKVLDELPILGLKSVTSVSRMIADLGGKGVLDSVHMAMGKGKGSRIYVATSETYDALRGRNGQSNAIDMTKLSPLKDDRRDENVTSLDSTSRRDSTSSKELIVITKGNSGINPPVPMTNLLDRYIDERFRAVQLYENFGRERRQIKVISSRCRRANVDDPQKAADFIIAVFGYLRESDTWWGDKPFIPSELVMNWDKVVNHGRKAKRQLEDRAWWERFKRGEAPA